MARSYPKETLYRVFFVILLFLIVFGNFLQIYIFLLYSYSFFINCLLFIIILYLFDFKANIVKQPCPHTIFAIK